MIKFNFKNPKDNLDFEELILCQEKQYPNQLSMITLTEEINLGCGCDIENRWKEVYKNGLS